MKTENININEIKNKKQNQTVQKKELENKKENDSIFNEQNKSQKSATTKFEFNDPDMLNDFQTPKDSTTKEIGIFEKLFK